MWPLLGSTIASYIDLSTVCNFCVDRQTQTDRQTGSETDTQTHTDRHTQTHTHRHTDATKDNSTFYPKTPLINIGSVRKKDRHTDRQTDRQKERKRERESDQSPSVRGSAAGADMYVHL